MATAKVLLTGISGFLGSHTAIQLLNRGYQVTGTLRDLKRAASIKQIISKHTDHTDQLRFVEADLLDEKIWHTLTKNTDFVQHIASPFPRTLPKREEDLIIPAKQGTLHILKAAAVNNVTRVVLTSSTATIAYGKAKEKRNGVFNETNWTDENNTKDTTAYFRSKTIAEKAAWEFMQSSGTSMQLTTVLPGAMLGPVLEEDFGTSANIVIKPLDGSTPAIPNIGFDIVDVRSVADLLILAMEKPEAANQRFVGVAGYASFKEVVNVLQHAYPGRKLPGRALPDMLTRIFATFEKSLQPVLLNLGVKRISDHSKAMKMLGWQPIPVQEAILSCAKSVIDLGLVKK